VPPELIADGLLLNSLITEGVPACCTTEPLPEFESNMITGGCPDGGIGFCTWVGNVKHPGMRNNSRTDRERKTNLFNVVTSKIFIAVTSTRGLSLHCEHISKTSCTLFKYLTSSNLFLLIAACY
jgi:hypothetical protein